MRPSIAMMTKMNNYFSPNKIVFGNGAVSQVGKEARRFGAPKSLLVQPFTQKYGCNGREEPPGYTKTSLGDTNDHEDAVKKQTEEQKKLLSGVPIHPKIFETVAMDRQRSVIVTMAGEQLIKLR